MTGYHSPYYEFAAIAEAANAGQHREIVGGLWDELGAFQLDLLTRLGLKPSHRILDVGCGSLRGGIHFIRFLDAKNYFGTDINRSLLDQGYEKELVPLGLKDKLPRENLAIEDQFSFVDFGVAFDRALAFSVFTHLPLNSLRVCLEKMAAVMGPGGIFHVTIFEIPEAAQTSASFTHPEAGVVTHGDKDPYHYRYSDIEHVTKGLPWRLEYVGDIGHPRGQRLVNFIRQDDSVVQLPAADKRELSVEESFTLEPGEDHYRAYVGPPGRFDFMSATQFALLFQMGMKDNHRILDFGCGSLRLGRLLIPFLQKGGYFGIDPNKWLIGDGIERELGADAVRIKSPRFDYNTDYDCGVFGNKFDFIMAQSIVTHTGPGFMTSLFSSVAKNLEDNGLFLFSYTREHDEDAPLPADGWYYPGCVGYSRTTITKLLADCGLKSIALPWFHPGADWHVAALDDNALPPTDRIGELTGQVLTRP